MKTTSDVVACVADHGIFYPIAQRLARDFKKVYYWTPTERAFATVKDIYGDGFDDVERVESLWEVHDEVDLFMFPDIGWRDLQRHLVDDGHPVWGPRDGDLLEISRGKFLEALMQTDLPVPKYVRVEGMTALKAHLVDKTDKWIKISRFRGDWETLHFRDWDQDETTLDIAAVDFGPWKEQIAFYVFDPIETTIEDGYDGWCIDGQWPSLCIHGMECKDKAYLGAFQQYDDLPEQVRKVTDTFGPILGKYGYRGFFSAEVRITKDNESYFIDPTCRAGSPPSQVQTEMIANYGDIIWHGAQGEVVNPEPAAKVGVQAVLCASAGRNNWLAVEIPEQLKQWVKCGSCSQIDGRLVFPTNPDNLHGEIGWLVAVGDSPKEAIDCLKDYAAELPDGLCAKTEAIVDLIHETEDAEKQGIELTQQPMPEPAEVIEKETT